VPMIHETQEKEPSLDPLGAPASSVRLRQHPEGVPRANPKTRAVTRFELFPLELSPGDGLWHRVHEPAPLSLDPLGAGEPRGPGCAPPYFVNHWQVATACQSI